MGKMLMLFFWVVMPYGLVGILDAKICEPGQCNSKRGREDGKGKVGEQDALCAIASPRSPYLGLLAMNICIFVMGNVAWRCLAASTDTNMCAQL
jgi:hypothetical protein